MAPKGEFSQGLPPDVPSTLAYPKDYQAGVPASMSYAHTRSDFAVVPQRFFANTPAGTRYSDAISFAPFEIFGFAFGYLVDVPGVRTVLLQGNRHLRWIQDFDATMPRGRAFKLATLTKDSFYTPGAASPVNFAHGPVGPGLEAGYDRGSTGPFCLLCRHGNQLRGGLPLFSGAGTAMSGLLWNPDMGGWTLRHGYHVLASGHYVLAPDVSLPADAQTYTLTASSHPGTSGWQLSTTVTDSWRFTSAAGDGVIPLLMASYLPRTTLAGTLPPGPVSWPLDFGNLGPADAAVSKATVSLSTDGGHTWRPATVTRTDRNSFAASYPNPAATGTNRYLSVRVTGLDAAGRTVTETAIRAYRLTTRTSDGPTARPAVDVTPTDSATLGRQVPGLGTRACAHATKTRSSCYAVVMAGESGGLLAGGEPAGLGANDIRDAYDIPNSQSQQTVAVVVAYDYPTAEADLATYRRHYGLPPCTTANGCFRKINQRGAQGSYPDPDPGWSVEAALDMQMISAACPTCRIVLAEADLPSGKDLAATTNAAVAAGARVTNHSYGIGEHTGVRSNNAAYDHPGVTAVAASGDSGYGPASFPASSSSVIAVGGTVLHHADNPRGWRENAWQYGGSGCSAYFARLAARQGVQHAHLRRPVRGRLRGRHLQLVRVRPPSRLVGGSRHQHLVAAGRRSHRCRWRWRDQAGRPVRDAGQLPRRPPRQQRLLPRQLPVHGQVRVRRADRVGYTTGARPLRRVADRRLAFAIMDIPCVGAIIHDAEGRIVVVRRGRPPSLGLWSLPGGRVETGESEPDAVRREVHEETGLQVDVLGRAGSVVLPGARDGDRYLVADYLATVIPRTPTEPRAGDDADEARWASEPELQALDTTPGLMEALQRWGVWVHRSG